MRLLKLSSMLSTILTITLQIQFCNGSRILGIFPLNIRSHFVMFEALMKDLARRGHQVDVVSHFPQAKPLPNYKDLSLKGTLPNMVNNETYKDAQAFTSMTSGAIKKITEAAGDEICKLLGHPILQNIIKHPPLDPPYDLYITEVCMTPCYMIFGHVLKVPVIGVMTTRIADWAYKYIGNPINSAYSPSLFSSYSEPMTFWERLANTLLTNAVNLQMAYHLSRQDEYVEMYIGPNSPSVEMMAKNISLLFVNSHFSVDENQPYVAGVVEVGGLHIDTEGELPQNLKRFLDGSKDGCIYMSFGSMLKIESFPEEQLLEIYAAFRKIAPIRVLMKIANKNELPQGLPDNVLTASWLPQVQVLEHKNTKIFITHGGLMGTQEAIYSRVPMIGYPLNYDQHGNMMKYVTKKIAISLDYKKISERQLTDAINEILKTPAYRDNIERLSKLYYDRPMSSKDTASFWVEYVLRNGHALRFPASELSWWQSALLDVYATLLLSVISTLLIVKFICMKVLRFLYRKLYCHIISDIFDKKKNR